MAKAAHVTSIDEVRFFKAALAEFEASIRDALTQLSLEIRREIDWLEHDRSKYWPREARRASDRVSEARIALERCELAIDPDDRRGCYDEKKALQKAKQRLRLCEEKIPLVHKWVLKVKHEADEFSMQTAKMTHTLDADLPKAVASLSRMAKALEKYASRSGPVETTHQPAQETIDEEDSP